MPIHQRREIIDKACNGHLKQARAEVVVGPIYRLQIYAFFNRAQIVQPRKRGRGWSKRDSPSKTCFSFNTILSRSA